LLLLQSLEGYEAHQQGEAK